MSLPLLTHYAAAPVDRITPMEPQSSRPQPKPCGFWVSIDERGEGWADWCRGEQFRLNTLTYIHDVRIWPKARIMLITDAAALDEFTLHYGENAFREVSFSTSFICWDRVAEKFDGIIIAPYIWSRRLSHGSEWYYGWDCASGCIWDANAIASIKYRVPA